MFDEQSQGVEFANNRPRRSVSSVREELVSLKEGVRRAGAVQDIFNRKIVTMRDVYFLPEISCGPGGNPELSSDVRAGPSAPGITLTPFLSYSQ